jgi:hypothetical protein
VSRYADLPALKGYLGLGTETDQDFLLQACLDAAESGIDDYTRRSFVGTAGTHYASRWEQNRVVNNTFWLQEDLHTLVSLTLGDGQSVPVGSVWLIPREGPPYRGVQLKSSYVYTWNTDQDMVIAGTFGYGTVAPAIIQQATLEYATHLYRSKDITPNDQIGYEQGAGVQPVGRGMPDGVRWKIHPYKSKTGGAV